MTRVLNVDRFIADIAQRPAIWNRNYHCNKAFMEETWDELSEKHSLPKLTLKAKWKGLRDNFRVEFKRIPRDEVTGEMVISPEQHDSKWVHYRSLLFLARTQRTLINQRVEHMRNRAPKLEKMDQYYYNDMLDYDDSNSMAHISAADFLASASNTPPAQQQQTSSTNGRFRNELIEIPDDYYSSTPNSTMNVDGVTVNMGTLTAPKSRIITNGVMKRKRSTYEESNGCIEIKDEETPPPIKNIKHDDDYHFLMSLQPFMAQLTAEQKLKVRMKMQKLIFRELFSTESNTKVTTDTKVTTEEPEKPKECNDEKLSEIVTKVEKEIEIL